VLYSAQLTELLCGGGGGGLVVEINCNVPLGPNPCMRVLKIGPS